MKRHLLLIMLTLVLQSALAQDFIVKVNGDEIPARVMEITLQEVVYLQPDTTEEMTFRIPKKEVFMIRFGNGTKEVFTENLPEQKAIAEEALSAEQLYRLGTRDAILYYKGNGVMWGSAASTALLFPYGLAGAAILGFTPPGLHPDKVSDVGLLSYPEYVRGYQGQAKRQKRKKAAAGAGIGAAVVVGAVLVVLSTWQ